MAPPRGPREPSIDRTVEYEEFMKHLAAFHEKRGTNLDREPRVGSKHVNLLKLYRVVNARGGYDAVSAEKLAWRKIGQEFNLGNANLPALAFNLKSTYYKNLAAYEIATIHQREPPPKEILEDISARGGDLLNRTIENFKPPAARETGNLANGHESEGSGDEEHKTPKAEKMDVDELGSGGRVTRGLRQAPPQRVLFQPDLSTSRQTRHSGNAHSPQPPAPSSGGSYTLNASSNPNSMSFTIANYEPRLQMPLTLRGVITPANNPTLFKERQRITKEATAPKGSKFLPTHKGLMLPGTGFDGPNIYIRTLMALRSRIPEEQAYALHHLVKISHERGDKYKFEAFPGLAEALIEKVLEVSSLYYDVDWEISYEDEGPSTETNILDGMSGTADILQRIQSLRLFDARDDMETEEFNEKLRMIDEAGLVIRNMAMLEENAVYLSQQYPLRDFLCIALNLPNRAAVVELQHYALDIAEQLTRYWCLDAEDPLYMSLLKQLDGPDRGSILTALRAISRISMNLEENNRLKGVPIKTIQRICEWTLIDDEEFVHACLDFLYQYTAVIENVELMLEKMEMGGLISQLVRLLLHGAKEVDTRMMLKPPVKGRGATDVCAIPDDLLEQILKFEEPERSAHWLRACFEEDADSDITQIALWQAYQSRFSQFSTPQRGLLPAAEFIKTVSNTFSGANAQVINGPTAKFIIKGIRPRHLPMDLKGRLYARCLWKEPDAPNICGEFLLKPQKMWEHLIDDHLHVTKLADGRYDFTPAPYPKYNCHWNGCRHFASTNGNPSPYDVGMHIKVHLPDTSKKAPLRAKHNKFVGPESPREAEYMTFSWFNTTVDERGDAAGLPLTSALVLRNLARNIPKTNPSLNTGVGGSEEAEDDKDPWVRKLFGPVMAKLWFVMAHNRSLAGYMADLMAVIAV